MGDLEKRIKETEIRKLITEFLGIKGTAAPEHTAQSETVIAIVRKEAEMAIAPSDTQCRADVEGNRCENEICFNMINFTFSQMCEEHDKQNEDARGNVKGATKVLKFVDA